MSVTPVGKFFEQEDAFSKKNVTGLTKFIKDYASKKFNVNDVDISERDVLIELRQQKAELNRINFNDNPLHFNNSLVTLKNGEQFGTSRPVDLTKYLHQKAAGAIIARIRDSDRFMDEWKNYDPRGKDHSNISYNPIDIGALKIRNRREQDVFMEFVGPGA